MAIRRCPPLSRYFVALSRRRQRSVSPLVGLEKIHRYLTFLAPFQWTVENLYRSDGGGTECKAQSVKLNHDTNIIDLFDRD